MEIGRTIRTYTVEPVVWPVSALSPQQAPAPVVVPVRQQLQPA
jgi:hypothetical protein